MVFALSLNTVNAGMKNSWNSFRFRDFCLKQAALARLSKLILHFVSEAPLEEARRLYFEDFSHHHLR